MKHKATTMILGFCLVLSCGLASAQGRALQATYLDDGYDNSGLSIPAETCTAVGPAIQVTCPGSHTCTVQALHSIQFGGGSSSGNEVAIDFILDGTLLGLAQEVGEAPTDGFAVFSAQEQLSGVSLGSHTVQTAVCSSDGTAVYNYDTTYNVYKP